MNEVGYVLSIQDYLAYLDGLPTIRIDDIVENDQGIRGTVAALKEDKVEVWILDEGMITPGQIFKRTDKKLSVGVGDFLLGRAINPLGVPIDGKGPVSKTRGEFRELHQNAPPMGARQFITDQFITGITLIDTLIPIGKGQRQLILGDAHSGKTPFLVDVVVNQIKTGTICIYAAIGKPITQVREIIDTLTTTGVLQNTIIIAASSTESPALIFYTPYSALSIAEFFQKQGKDILVILDDMGTHAKFYRELSLLGSRSPGRQSYPGDIFYTHATLMERAGRFKKTSGGGSITALPVIELEMNDFTSFIPTNLMSMTDGHILFKSELYSQGYKPAIDSAISVTRVGRQTQNRMQTLLCFIVRQILAQAAQLETLTRFSAELPPETQLLLQQKGMIDEIHKQEALTFLNVEVQVMLLGLVFTSFLKDKNKYFVQKNKSKIIKFLSDPKNLLFGKQILKLSTINQLVDKLELLVPQLKRICQ